MAEIYRIFGSEMSPYSVKVRSYFRFKGVPHRWIARNAASDEDYKRFAKLPIVPTVATPEDEGQQDSTPIMERAEARFPEPSMHPADPTLGFLSALIEEFGDEWGNKLMFHHRWYADVDQAASAQTLARLSLPNGTTEEVAQRTRMVRERMTGRGHFVGSSDANAPLITGYYLELLDILEAHLATRKYLFGARPSFGDFGLYAQLYECSVDPTCGGMIRARGPAVLDWCHRMLEPRVDGDFERWDSLAPTLTPLLSYIGRYFLPWTTANAAALAAGDAEFSVDLAGTPYVQPPQKYHAKSLGVLRERYAVVAGDAGLAGILADAGCLPFLTPA
ncbi:MAG: glutathione S-transferase family protein [Alphaproteobacteria bacterium]|nr:glutathione S-transferase family protein [Alphaproteobacteria bacterium]MBU1515286.1 glutathione S-transferase family protein [Alphaproteobacteria bacterium]MBU2092416.1 glutathione S-transferase family protein [Alphaproteobacteria bacterium]MBU2153010.1 glutathione S-transferase family protein [Alphaproteobacteria bacterium]MBU2305841.1 glutathione S-transferase family protein [Alphaproteobacteria bacterium]